MPVAVFALSVFQTHCFGFMDPNIRFYEASAVLPYPLQNIQGLYLVHGKIKLDSLELSSNYPPLSNTLTIGSSLLGTKVDEVWAHAVLLAAAKLVHTESLARKCHE